MPQHKNGSHFLHRAEARGSRATKSGGTWGFYGSQHTLTNCFNEAENVLILETDGQVGHFTLGPGQTAYFGNRNFQAWDYMCSGNRWPRMKVNPDAEPTVFGTPNDEAYCAVIN
jgi:hypothetical protein